MKFSLKWIREWVDPTIHNDKLFDQLTMIGFNVERSKNISIKCSTVFIGEIIEFKKNLEINNAQIIKIHHGHNKLINVICYDNVNYQKYLRVVVAKSGTLLPNGQIIKPILIQGEKLDGILCNYSTLGLNNNLHDIIRLPQDAPIGCNFYEYLDLHDDDIVDINITPNRGDCLSIMGLAREIATVNQLKLKKIKINDIKSTIQDTISIVVENPDACPIFVGRILKNIDTAMSTPLKIQEKLRRCGICPIDIVTDIVHYVSLELGHPIYAFDYNKINQNTIQVRFSKKGETLLLPNDNINLKLYSNTLIIADYNKPLAIAGIIIGNKSYVNTKTRNIFLQSAFFKPSKIIGQSKLYKLHTFSTIRYERGVDPNISELALNYATSLLLQICNGHTSSVIRYINQDIITQLNNCYIILYRTKLDKIIGFHITNQIVTNILKNLGFQTQFKDNYWIVLIPTWRFDITIEENIIAEIIRIYGYNQIPQTIIQCNPMQSFQHKNSTISLSRFKTALIDRGYQEIITYSFVDPKIQKLLYPKQMPLNLINPISVDMSVMRLSLWTGLIKTTIYNQNRQKKHIRLFESGICFIPSDTNKNQITQKLMISGIRSGFRYNEHWNLTTCLVDFYDIKGDVEFLLNITNKFNKIEFKKCMHSALHPGKSAEIYLHNTSIGYIGMIHPIIQEKLHLHLNTLMFELSWSSISKIILPKITNISKFPKNYRDISLIIPNYISFTTIIDELKKININQLIEIKLIDLYLGDNFLKETKSLTIRLILQSTTHTLTEQEIEKIVHICIIVLEKKFHASVR